MEDKKVFHQDDAFFIAERLDSIQNSLPIIPHEAKEFHDNDAYIIWTKLSPAVAPVVGRYGQVYSQGAQGIAVNDPLQWTAINESNGVSFVAGQVTVALPGIYRFDWVVELVQIPN